MPINCKLIGKVQENQQSKTQEHDERALKCKQNDKRECLKQDYQLKFDWKSRILHMLV